MLIDIYIYISIYISISSASRFAALILTLVIRGFVQAASSEMETVNLEPVAINMDCVNEDLNNLDQRWCLYEVEDGAWNVGKGL